MCAFEIVFSSKKSVLQRGTKRLEVTGELLCLLEVESHGSVTVAGTALTIVVDGLRYHGAQLENLPCGQREGGLEAEPH